MDTSKTLAVLIAVGLTMALTGIVQAAVIDENFDDGDDPPVTLGTTWSETDSVPWSVQTDGAGYDYQFARSGGTGYTSSSMYTVSDRIPGSDFSVSVDLEIDSLVDSATWDHFWPGVQIFGPSGTGYTARWTARHEFMPGTYEGLLALDKGGTQNVAVSSSQLASGVGTTYTLTVDGSYDGSGNLTLDASITDGTDTVTTSYTDTSPLSGTDFGVSAFQCSMDANADFDDFQIDYAELGTMASITTADGNGADAFVAGETDPQGSTNNGSATSLYAQDYAVDNSSMSFLRFDISGVTQPVNWAELDLVSLGWQQRPIRIHGLKDSENADNWGEMTITYQNAPGLMFVGRGSADVDLTKADLLATITQVAAGSTLSFSGTDLLSFLESDTDGLVTFIVTDDSPDAAQGWALGWASKENTTYDSPTLVLYQVAGGEVIPEPSTFAIWALGVLGLAFLGWRRGV